MNNHFGSIESLVRVLIGLPISMSYFYLRHYDTRLAYLLLAAGLAMMAAALDYELRASPIVERRSK
jgi:hypothetical protein